MRHIICILALLICGHAANAQVVVIANKFVPISTAEATFIKNCYKLVKQSWEDGSKIVVFDTKKKSKTSDQFYNFIGTKRRKMKKLWLKKQLTGEVRRQRHWQMMCKLLTKLQKHPAPSALSIKVQ